MLAAIAPFLVNLSPGDARGTETHPGMVPPGVISILIIPHLFNRGSISIPNLSRGLIEIMSPELPFHKQERERERRKESGELLRHSLLQGLSQKSSGTVTEWDCI